MSKTATVLHCKPANSEKVHILDSSAVFLISRGADKVVAGDFGQRFRDELEQAGIICVQKTGPISAVLADNRQP
jgi:hypothetical protein